ncbi:MAG: cysteine desulfurase family protein [Planctomycetota bacterium]|nr:cysteine desulfurase family protein [Planctomycetota bacterium]
MRQIYLDYNATTPIAPSVQEAMLPFLTEHYGNPSSSHSPGRACHEAIEDSRDRVASLLGADRDEIVFTGSGTESNNLALKGIMMARAPVFDGHLVISALEHPAIAEPARYLEKLGCRVSVVGCNRHGVVEPDAVAAVLKPDTKLVSIMHANNEIGTIQPLKEISEVCRSRNILFHTDAAQTIGKIRTFVEELGVDMLTIAGHKLYAPKGVGALYVRQGVALEPYTHGAAHEGGLRPGTENTAFIVALGHACFLAGKAVEDASDRMADLRDRLSKKLLAAIGSDLTINGSQAARLPNTLSVNFPDVSGGELLARTPEIAASTGSACHASMTKLSATLAAIQLAPDQARGTIRLSVGWYTSEEDVDRAAELLIGAWESLR